MLHATGTTKLQLKRHVQERGLSHPMEDVKGDFRKLLEMMAALYNLRTGGADKELQIDQMQVLINFYYYPVY